MEHKASAVWRGSLREGKGLISSSSGALKEVPYTFKTRFEGEKGTNPEELIGAAHSACFSMALGGELGKAKITPETIETSATVILEQADAGFAVTQSKLVTVVTAAGADKEAVEKAAASAKENCPISKLLNAKISLDLKVNV